MARLIKAISYRSIGDRSWLEAPLSPSIKSHARRRGTECRVRRAPTQPRGISPMLKSVSNSLILRGALAVIVGIIALAWPGPTALVLVLIVAIWAVTAGIFEIFAGFGARKTAGTRALFFLAGLVSVAFGVVLFAHPRIGAFALALLFGLYALVYGVSLITQGIEVRRFRKNLHSVTADAA